MNGLIKFTPVDTWFFGSGAPFNAGESNLDMESVFPPSNRTIVGAIRAALAREIGWNGDSRWNEEIKRILGDGDDLSPLKFTGPRLMKGDDFLFPAPLNLVRERDGKKIHFLQPSDSQITCDIGKKRIPTIEKEGVKVIRNTYINKTDIKRVLNGDVPSDVIGSDMLWKEEFREGIKLDDETSTTGDDAIYTTERIRLLDDTALSIYVENAPSELTNIKALALGGESGLANMDVDGKSRDEIIPQIPSIDADDGKIRFTINLMTPAFFKDLSILEKKIKEKTGADIVTVCTDKPKRIGGWNSLKNTSIPLQSFYPNGSVFFCETDENYFDDLKTLHGEKIGDYTDFGFGEMVIGVWKKEEKK